MVGVPVDRGCPYDCGLCTEHEQHTCIGLVELTDACNLECPMCYAASGPGQKHRTVEECKAAIDRLVKFQGLQSSKYGMFADFKKEADDLLAEIRAEQKAEVDETIAKVSELAASGDSDGAVRRIQSLMDRVEDSFKEQLKTKLGEIQGG